MASGNVLASALNDIQLDAKNCTLDAGIEEDIVDPWKIVASSAKGVDYDKLISKYDSINIINCIYYISLVYS